MDDVGLPAILGHLQIHAINGGGGCLPRLMTPEGHRN